MVWEEEPIRGLNPDHYTSGTTGGSPGPQRAKRADCIRWLEGKLQVGPVPSSLITDEGKELGYSEATMRRAKDELGVESEREGGRSGKWVWRLPEGKTEEREAT